MCDGAKHEKVKLLDTSMWYCTTCREVWEKGEIPLIEVTDRC